jgi:branched-chain amino acid transport system substrate-binding protein
MKRTVLLVASLVVALLLLLPPAGVKAFQDDGTLRIGAQWAMSTVVAVFGVNANALFSLAIDEINEAGGVKIGGKAVRIDKRVFDDACNAEQGLSVARRLATADQVLVSLGPTCSSVAEPVFGTLQKRLDDPNDTGIQMPYFTDQAIKFGLAKISPWAFRNVGNEPEMYDFIFKHLKEKFPEYKKVAVGYESDFAHSASTYK